MNTNEKGDATVAKIVSMLVSAGLRVSLPFGEYPYDLVVEMKKKMLKVQCKTGRYRDGKVIFKCVSEHGYSNGKVFTDYKGQIDTFFVYCGTTDKIYSVPIKGATRSTVSLRVEPTANQQEKNVRWAKDYEMPL